MDEEKEKLKEQVQYYKMKSDWLLFVGRWNTLVKNGKCTPERQRQMEHARSFYQRNRCMKPGEAANKIAESIIKDLHETPPDDIRTIIDWIKDLALPEAKRRGRPRKK